MKCWVNIYHGLYAHSSDGAPYYISLGYESRSKALAALDSPKAKSIEDRYIATVQIPLKQILQRLQNGKHNDVNQVRIPKR